MTDEEYDLRGLADYLQVPSGQVEKLADRGHLPGRRVGGAWRFSRAEIHHWMEDRMGGLGSDELADIEHRHRSPHGAGGDPAVAHILPVSAVELPLMARTRVAVVKRLTKLAEETGVLWDAARMAEAVMAREDMQSTALENGVALLHPRRPRGSILGDNIMSLGVASSGIPFGARQLTDIFFLICSVDDRTHLRILARVSRLLAREDFLSGLRRAESREEAHAWLARHEELLLTESRD